MVTEGPHRELLIARHGQGHCNLNRVIAGSTCSGLTEEGRAQAQALGKRLAGEGGVTAIHASTTRRALETAGIVGAALGVPIQEQIDLRFPDAGAAEGQAWVEARAQWGIDPLDPIRPAAEGAESWRTYVDRAAGVLDSILDEHPGGRVLVVGHSETIAAMYALLLGSPDLGRLKVGMWYCALSAWQATRERPGSVVAHQRWTLVAHNDARHVLSGWGTT
ncbi:histidine phosphatase family protein [Planosporangium mesophilum]|uniref:Histidine phosphatase family protein n=1 Tax=Planosporangium mesophilum TaxID=689768 RepID=A0A8J3TSK2_9ACTN|nr:histidine phosphatase family protein [Planosporangium mesophilum]NJC86813.1 histidine phosphatase family protein [Planosporangium mesophilum]GII26520.1 hypothetical protein Pme01_61170 [Planosporangium mesophilum]